MAKDRIKPEDVFTPANVAWAAAKVAAKLARIVTTDKNRK